MTGTARNYCFHSILNSTGNSRLRATLCLLYGVCALILSDSAGEAASLVRENSNSSRTWQLITRSEWKAREPTGETNFTGPSPYVIVHHSYQPGICHTMDACKASMRSIQNFHMDGHGWSDIGYSFAIGGDGNVYGARGYNVVGAHAPNYNSQSIGLLLIGNFMSNLPPAPMLQVAQEFINYSVEIGQLREDYILYGHRQVRSTDCPGDALYAEITKWSHWRETDQKKILTHERKNLKTN